jgi:hypothetical protein
MNGVGDGGEYCGNSDTNNQKKKKINKKER